MGQGGSKTILGWEGSSFLFVQCREPQQAMEPNFGFRVGSSRPSRVPRNHDGRLSVEECAHLKDYIADGRHVGGDTWVWRFVRIPLVCVF